MSATIDTIETLNDRPNVAEDLHEAAVPPVPRSIEETGIALLEVHFTVRNPAFIGDTIHVEVEAAEARAASRGNRGIVTTDNRVFNQDSELVLEYRPVRMIRGDPARDEVTARSD